MARKTGPLPRQEGIRLAKKGSFSSVPNADFCRFQVGYPFPPHLYAERGKDGEGKGIPAVLVFAGCPLAGATSRQFQTTD